MTSTTFGTFTIERSIPASPEKVFKAFADLEEKNKWFGPPPGGKGMERSFEFTVGGKEHMKGEYKPGALFSFDATYQDIVPNERIIYTYYMYMDENLLSVSLATILFTPQDDGTQLSITEQGAFLDGFDKPEIREHGTNDLADKIVALFS
jgi:uncharacterized protein YndB with AHSA1/START domain